MILIWSLLVLGMAAISAAQETAAADTAANTAANTATTTAAATTLSPVAEAEAQENSRLQSYLNQYESKCTDNGELSNWMDRISSALKYGKLNEKIQVRIEFASYNTRRLELENEIADRIEELDDLIPQQQPYTKCSLFYQKQRRNLRKAKNLSNERKAIKLKENSVECVDDYDYDFDYPFRGGELNVVNLERDVDLLE